MKNPLDFNDIPGAITLLRDCVGGRPGERLLIVREPKGSNYYDEIAPSLAASAARSLGMKVYETESASFVSSDNEKTALMETLDGFDHVVFFSRIGDQIRFLKDQRLPSSTMCYTLNHDSLNSMFGAACYQGMSEIKNAIDDAFASAKEIKVTCPLGTNYTGTTDFDGTEPVEVNIKRFPLLVPRPVPSKNFRGRIALSRFLVGTGSNNYDPSYLALPNNVFAILEGNKITEFEGAKEDIERIENHYRNVSQQLSIRPWYVDSWHAGIHPGCHFETAAESDIMRWAGSAFGNPRILHFHTCGDYAPGEICWHVIDPTISIDGVAVWDNGVLFPDRLKNGKSMMDRHPKLTSLFKNPYRNIGIAS